MRVSPRQLAVLEELLMANGFQPVYAFSKRQTIEQKLPDGSVKKVIVFKHEGFIEVPVE